MIALGQQNARSKYSVWGKGSLVCQTLHMQAEGFGDRIILVPLLEGIANAWCCTSCGGGVV